MKNGLWPLAEFCAFLLFAACVGAGPAMAEEPEPEADSAEVAAKEVPRFENTPFSIIEGEEYRLVSPHKPESHLFAAFAEKVFKRLYPKHDLMKDPVLFFLSEDENPNAFTTRARRPRVLIFTTGLVHFVHNEDEFAAILGHEWGHHEVNDSVGKGKNSKAEEMAADLLPLERMHKAGYDVRQTLEFHDRIAKKFKQAPKWAQIVDEHPSNEVRRKAILAALTVLDRKYGGLKNNRTGMPSDVVAAAKTAKHISFLGAQSRSTTELDFLLQHIGALSRDNPARTREFVTRIRSLKIDVENKEELKRVHRLADAIIDHPEIKNDPNSQSQLYLSLSGVYRRSQKAKDRRTMPMGKFRAINKAIKSLRDAATKDEAISMASVLIASVSAVQENANPESRLLTEVDWVSEKGIQPDLAQWNKTVGFAEESHNDTLIRALQLLKVNNPILQAITDADLDLSIRLVEAPALSFDTREMKDEFRQEFSKRARDLSLRLFKLAMSGNAKAEEAFRRLLANKKIPRPQSDQFIGLDSLDSRFELFTLGNEFPLSSFSSAIRESTKTRLAKLLKRNRSFFDEVSKHLRAAKGDARKQWAERFRYHKDFLISMVEAEFSVLSEPLVLEESNSATQLPTLESILSLPVDVLDLKSKVSLIDHWLKFSRESALHRGIGTMTLMEFTKYLSSVRRGLGYSAPRSGAEFERLLLEFPELKNTSIAAAEYYHVINFGTGDARLLNFLPVYGDYILESPSGGNEKITTRDYLAQTLSHRFAWPRKLEERISAYRLLATARLVRPDRPEYVKILSDLTLSIASTRDPKKRLDLLAELVSGSRIAIPKIREQIYKMIAESIFEKFGYDIGSEEYIRNIRPVFEKLVLVLPIADRADVFSQATNIIESQRNLSSVARDMLFSFSREQIVSAGEKMVFGEAGVFLVREEKEIRFRFIEFLMSDSGPEAMKSLLAEFRYISNPFVFIEGFESYHGSTDAGGLNPEVVTLAKQRFRAWAELSHRNFWNAPLPIRSMVLDELLFPAHGESNFDEVFKMIGRIVFPENSKYGTEAFEILKQYVNVVPTYQRSFLLSAVMASAQRDRSGRSDSVDVGARLAHVLEIMGPAETKVGQALHSHRDVPDDIKSGMRRLKSAADVPSRWDLFELYDSVVPSDLRDQVMRVGQVLGAASYFVVVDLGDKVVSLLRPNALARAENGFELLKALVAHMNKDGRHSQVLSDLVVQAQKMAKTETDSAVASKQFEIAARLYDGMSIRVGKNRFHFSAAKLLSAGDGYRVMQKAEGVHFNDLPENSPKAIAFKRDLARAYVALELSLILKGMEFDHDRHGAQLKIHGNQVTLFDFGAMALDPPNSKDRAVLASVMVSALSASDGAAIDTLMRELLEASKNHPESRAYLATVQRGILALGDFAKYLEPSDFSHIARAIVQYGEIHPEIIEGLFAENARAPRGAEKFSAMLGGEGLENCEQLLIEISEKSR